MIGRSIVQAKLVRGRWKASERTRSDRTKGSGKIKVQAMRRVKESLTWKNLNTRARSVFHTLWNYAGDPETDADSGEVALRHCFPSVATIAEDENCSPDTVNAALKNLRKARLVEWVRTGRSNLYVLFPPPEVCEPIRKALLQNEAVSDSASGRDQIQEESGIRTRAIAASTEPTQRSLKNNLHQQHNANSGNDDAERGSPELVVVVVNLLTEFGVWREEAERLARLPHMTELWVRAAIRLMAQTKRKDSNISNAPAMLKSWCENPDRIQDGKDFKRILVNVRGEEREREREARFHFTVTRPQEEKVTVLAENRRIADNFRPIWLEESMTDSDRLELVEATLHDIRVTFGLRGIRLYLPGYYNGCRLFNNWSTLGAALQCDLQNSSDSLGISLLAACARMYEKRTALTVRSKDLGKPPVLSRFG